MSHDKTTSHDDDNLEDFDFNADAFENHIKRMNQFPTADHIQKFDQEKNIVQVGEKLYLIYRSSLDYNEIKEKDEDEQLTINEQEDELNSAYTFVGDKKRLIDDYKTAGNQFLLDLKTETQSMPQSFKTQIALAQHTIVFKALEKLDNPNVTSSYEKIKNFHTALKESENNYTLATRSDTLFETFQKYVQALFVSYKTTLGNERTKGTKLMLEVGLDPKKSLADVTGANSLGSFFMDKYRNKASQKDSKDEDDKKNNTTPPRQR